MTMSELSMEIKVTLLGHVSVGKLTVLNALLQDKFSEVPMRRTTAGVNFFRISAANIADKNSNRCFGNNQDKLSNIKSEPSDSFTNNAIMEGVQSASSGDPRSAASTFTEIKSDNTTLCAIHGIQTKIFDIELNTYLCDMRPDTTLVVVDIPGVNEAGSSKKYLDYVNEQWHTFDCVVVIMDAILGVNSEEHIALLRLVQANTTTKQNMPIIVLCNKVDKPDDNELRLLVDKVCCKVEQIFVVDCHTAALHNTIQRSCLTTEPNDTKSTTNTPSLFPAFVPISAGNAFVYHCACRLGLDNFKKLDKELINKIGQFEVSPRKWKSLTQQQKYVTAYGAVSDESEYKEWLAAINFDKLLKVLGVAVGGATTQSQLIGQQLDIAMKKLDSTGNILQQLTLIMDQSKTLGQLNTVLLSETFFDLYRKQQAVAFATYEKRMDLHGLHCGMDQLVCFSEDFNMILYCNPDWSYNPSWKVGYAQAVQCMKGLIVHQCHVIAVKLYLYHDSSKWNEMMAKGHVIGPTWATLSPHDWHTMIGSVLLLAHHSKYIVKNFGRQKIILDRLQLELSPWFFETSAALEKPVSSHLKAINHKGKMHTIHNSFCKALCGGNSRDHLLCPKKYACSVQVHVPECLDILKHWGHLSWKFCEFLCHQENIGRT
jgi:GTPase SAR1 family protein